MPNAITVESMVGFGGWGEDELDNLKREINAMCLSTLPTVVDNVITRLDALERKE